MKKALFTILACMALVGFVGLPMLQAVEAPADMKIKAPDGYDKVTQPEVAFSHKGHAKMDCKACHHKGEATQKCSAAGCHDSKDSKDKTSEHSFYKAFHDMKSEHSCIGCHKKEAKGPTKCPECHPKKAS
jgi:hypothetical protein